MKYALGNMLNGAGGLNADGLSLDLQFATDKTLTARKGPTPVFTRGSGATQVGASGLIEYAPENLALQSENFGTTWVNNTGNALTLNDALSPTETLTADRIDFPATAAAGLIKQIQQSFSGAVAGNGPVTASVWLRTVSGTSTVYLTLLDGGAPWQRVHVACNVTTAWTRFSVTLNTPTLSLFMTVGPDTRTTIGTPAQPAVQDAASVYAWGAQLERYSTARTYIPTTTAAVYGARFDHDPVTLACKGLLIEESRTNLVFPSDTLTTQTRTVTAVAHTLSFYGAGTVVLSGVAIATVTGTGAYPTRTTLTFTPTAGSLTLTVTGSVTQAQVEAGTFPTSYIPTTTASLARSADVCSISGSSFSGFYNPLEGTMLANAFTPASGDRTVLTTDDNTSNEMIRLRTEGTNPFLRVIDGGSEVVAIDAGTVTANTVFKLIGAYKVNDFASSINGGSAVTDATGTIPTVDRMRIGAGQGGNTMCGCVSAIRYFKKRLSDAKLQALTV